MGKARDVVEIGLRSDPALSASCTPDVIYNILIQYFSSMPLCLPLQDFSSTLPNYQKRNPLTIGYAITEMFVKHCPDPEFASVFKYKQIHKWTPKEIQMRVDEYQRVSSVKMYAPKTHAAALICHEAHTEPHCACGMGTWSADSQSSPATPLGVLPPLSPSPVLFHNQQQSFSPVHQSPTPHPLPLSQNQLQVPPPLLLYHRASCLQDNSRVVMLCSVR